MLLFARGERSRRRVRHRFFDAGLGGARSKAIGLHRVLVFVATNAGRRATERQRQLADDRGWDGPLEGSDPRRNSTAQTPRAAASDAQIADRNPNIRAKV